ncbi:MAG: hypothetical protein ACTS27_00115 [Phycisphaerales bacterium]
MRSRLCELLGSMTSSNPAARVVEWFVIGDVRTTITARRINGEPVRHTASFQVSSKGSHDEFQYDELGDLDESVKAAMAIIDHLEGRSSVLDLARRLKGLRLESGGGGGTGGES